MRRLFRLFPIAALLLAACGGGTPVAQTPTEVPAEPTVAVEPTAAMTPTAEASPTPEVTPTVATMNNEDIAEKLRPATVLVLAQFAETPINTEGVGGGTGIVYDLENGYIITNAHVVEGASSVQVAPANSNRARPARVLGRAQCDDLAVLKVENTDGMEQASLGSSSTMKVGAEVVALGYPESFDLGNDLTVTNGTVSRLNAQRDKYQDLIQTDAGITHGNSGGPLVNRRGEVIGINTLGFYTAEGEREPNINFAIAMSQARPIIDALQEGKNRQYIGLNLYPNVFEDFFGTQDGLVVIGVASGSTASQVGIQPADLLLKLEGSSVNSEADVCNILRSHGDGDQIKAQILRASTGELMEGEMTVGKTGAADANVAKLAVVGTVAGADQSGGGDQAGSGNDGSGAAETAVANDGGNTGDISIVLASNFDTDTGDWPVGDDPDYAASVIDGSYEMVLRSPQQYLTVTPDKAANMTDGAISTELRISEATGYGGVIMRYNETDGKRSMYVCWISNAGQYGCSKAISNEWTTVAEPANDDVIKKNDVNRITMAAIGNEISLDINDKQVASFTDDSLTSGGTGFYIENFDDPVTVRFDNTAIVKP